MDEDQLKLMNKELWAIVNKHVGPTDQSILFALSGSMMKIAIQMYTVVLKDEDIEGGLDIVAGDIPKMREQMSSQIGERTLH